MRRNTTGCFGWALHFAQGDRPTAEDLVQDTYVRFVHTESLISRTTGSAPSSSSAEEAIAKHQENGLPLKGAKVASQIGWHRKLVSAVFTAPFHSGRMGSRCVFRSIDESKSV